MQRQLGWKRRVKELKEQKFKMEEDKKNSMV
jgi:hypothetical protein